MLTNEDEGMSVPVTNPFRVIVPIAALSNNNEEEVVIALTLNPEIVMVFSPDSLTLSDSEIVTVMSVLVTLMLSVTDPEPVPANTTDPNPGSNSYLEAAVGLNLNVLFTPSIFVKSALAFSEMTMLEIAT